MRYQQTGEYYNRVPPVPEQPPAASAGYRHSAAILEDAEGGLKKIEPDDQGGFNLFKRHGRGWNWADSIGEDSRDNLIANAHKVYICR